MARLKLANTLGNHDENTRKNERVLNGMVDAQGGRRRDDHAYVMKRPACVSTYTLATGQGGATFGQGLFVINTPGSSGGAAGNTLVGIRGDVLTTPIT